jgi:hypothetical protein
LVGKILSGSELTERVDFDRDTVLPRGLGLLKKS